MTCKLEGRIVLKIFASTFVILRVTRRFGFDFFSDELIRLKSKCPFRLKNGEFREKIKLHLGTILFG